MSRNFPRLRRVISGDAHCDFETRQVPLRIISSNFVLLRRNLELQILRVTNQILKMSAGKHYISRPRNRASLWWKLTCLVNNSLSQSRWEYISHFCKIYSTWIDLEDWADRYHKKWSSGQHNRASKELIKSLSWAMFLIGEITWIKCIYDRTFGEAGHRNVLEYLPSFLSVFLINWNFIN